MAASLTWVREAGGVIADAVLTRRQSFAAVKSVTA
jgi:hypothetical protein